MEKPKKLTGEQGAYIEYLEKKLEAFSPKKTNIRSYLALKKIVDDTNDLVMTGIEIEDPESGKTKKWDIVSEMTLISKDDKTIDRIFKFIDKLGIYNAELTKMEEAFTEDDINLEKELLKGTSSVESRIFGNG